MATAEQSIDVDVPLARLQELWEQFTEWVLVGNYRLLCDAWSCERMADGETVGFADLGGDRSRVMVSFDYEDDASPDPAEKRRRVSARLTQDLLRFREYAEAESGRGGRRRAGHREGDVRDDRSGRLRLTPDSIIERDRDDTYGSPHFQA
jgi:hypothetical protein